MVLAGLHQPLVAIETELMRLSQTADGKNTKQTQQRLVVISRRVRQLIAQISVLGQRQTHRRPRSR